MKNKKILTTFLFFTILTIFLKLDFRYFNELSCCGDDFDYYSHAYTIAVDKDFDYENQLLEPNDFTFYKNEKIAPLGFYGSGLLAAPFLYVGHILDNIFISSSVSYKIILYSLSAIFYLYASILLIYKSFKLLKINVNFIFLTICIVGSGLGYYAFERYSMTHVYEAFTVSLIFFSVINIHISKFDNRYILLLVLALFLGISVRFTNYHLFILPLIFEKLFFTNESKSLFKNIYFWFFVLIFSGVFYFINMKIYGEFILNPLNIYYSDANRLTEYFQQIENIFQFLSLNLIILSKIIFSQEFGIFWFSPLIFVGLIFSIKFVFKNKKNSYLGILILIPFIYSFGIVAVWSSTASSYGFRYLFSLIPFSIIIFLSERPHNSFMYKYVYFFSAFGLISILFFESTPFTELSTTNLINTFGKEDLYTNPTYLSGLLKSLLSITAVLKIFASSFLFLLVYKLFENVFDFSGFFSATTFNISEIQKEKFLNTLDSYSDINTVQVLIIAFFIYLVSKNISKIINQKL